jgi:hypothetical protein
MGVETDVLVDVEHYLPAAIAAFSGAKS